MTSVKTFFFFILLHIGCKSVSRQEEKSIQPIIVNKNKIRLDSIYASVSKGRDVGYKSIPGHFVYITDSNENGDVRQAVFSSKKESIENLIYSTYDDSRSDELLFNLKRIKLDSKLDPTSIKVYALDSDSKEDLLLIGKSQSASGSGQQITYFILLRDLQKVEFNSRFGNIHSLVKRNLKGELGYFNLKNGGLQNQYILTLRDIVTDEQLGSQQMILEYVLNDKFIIIQNSFF